MLEKLGQFGLMVIIFQSKAILKMKNRMLLLLLLLFPLSSTQGAEVKLSEQLESSLMKRLLGRWAITDSALDKQGQWQKGPGTSWHFYPILNGYAVQDDWISPPLNVPEPMGGRQFGTNIRIFNPSEQRWEMAWASSKGQKVDTFTATEKDGQIIMTGQFNGKSSRITFFDVKADVGDRLHTAKPQGDVLHLHDHGANGAPVLCDVAVGSIFHATLPFTLPINSLRQYAALATKREGGRGVVADARRTTSIIPLPSSAPRPVRRHHAHPTSP